MDMNRTPPWSLTESLPEMTAQAGIDFDEFVQWMAKNHEISELTEHFQVSAATINCLREQFMRYGISSVVGGD